MSKSLMELSASIITAQAFHQNMSMCEIATGLREVFHTLQELHNTEQDLQPSDVEADKTLDHLRQHPYSSVQRDQIICLECGKAYTLLAHRHLIAHDLTPTTYKKKWGLPRSTSLSAQSLTQRRRKLAKTLGTGQQLAAWRAQRRQPVG